MKEKFNEIFIQNKWGSNESVSGPSSTIKRTINLRETLPKIFTDLSINKIFDAPCGDLNWMHLIIKETKIEYIGGDIVSPLVLNIKDKYRHLPNVEFCEIDLTKDEFPNADLMICRDFFFHLSYVDTKKVLINFLASNIPYILTTTHLNVNELNSNNKKFENKNISTGGWRYMDLFIKPYNFPQPTLRIVDGGGDREMCLFTKKQISKTLLNWIE